MSKAPWKSAPKAAESPLQALLGELLARVLASAGEPGQKRSGTLPTEPALDRLARHFKLDAFERGVIALAALPMLEPASTDAIAAAQGDHRLKLPSLAYALSLLPGGHWSAFAPESTLRAHGLITLGDDPVSSARAIHLPERVLNHLLGLDALDEALVAYASEPATGGSLSPSHEHVAVDLAGRLQDGQSTPPLVAILGSERRSAFRLAAGGIEKAGGKPLWIEAEALPAGRPIDSTSRGGLAGNMASRGGCRFSMRMIWSRRTTGARSCASRPLSVHPCCCSRLSLYLPVCVRWKTSASALD